MTSSDADHPPRDDQDFTTSFTPPRWPASASLVLSLCGLAVSAYLVFEHYTAGATLACPQTATFNCAKVTTSSYAFVGGVPVAVLGLLFFAAMALLCLPQAWRSGGRRGALLRRVRLAGAASGVVAVLYLVWVELFAVGALCLWCTGVHVLAITLFAVVAVGSALLVDAED